MADIDKVAEAMKAPDPVPNIVGTRTAAQIAGDAHERAVHESPFDAGAQATHHTGIPLAAPGLPGADDPTAVLCGIRNAGDGYPLDYETNAYGFAMIVTPGDEGHHNLVGYIPAWAVDNMVENGCMERVEVEEE